MTIDLNALRQVIKQNQATQETRPDDPARQIVVDREGNVKFGSQAQGEQTTQVPQETFAAGIGARLRPVHRRTPCFGTPCFGMPR